MNLKTKLIFYLPRVEMQVLAEICWQDALGSLIARVCAAPFTAD